MLSKCYYTFKKFSFNCFKEKYNGCYAQIFARVVGDAPEKMNLKIDQLKINVKMILQQFENF